jgi:hypothetical protein
MAIDQSHPQLEASFLWKTLTSFARMVLEGEDRVFDCRARFLWVRIELAVTSPSGICPLRGDPRLKALRKKVGLPP